MRWCNRFISSSRNRSRCWWLALTGFGPLMANLTMKLATKLISAFISHKSQVFSLWITTSATRNLTVPSIALGSYRAIQTCPTLSDFVRRRGLAMQICPPLSALVWTSFLGVWTTIQWHKTVWNYFIRYFAQFISILVNTRSRIRWAWVIFPKLINFSLSFVQGLVTFQLKSKRTRADCRMNWKTDRWPQIRRTHSDESILPPPFNLVNHFDWSLWRNSLVRCVLLLFFNWIL